MTKEEIIALADKVASGLATDQEMIQYNRIYNHFQADHMDWDESLLGPKDKIGIELKDAILKRINRKTPIVRMQLTAGWKRWVAAAVLILALGAGTYFIFVNRNSVNAIAETKEPVNIPADAAPGKYKAMLTLANGEKIVLDSATLGRLANQGGTVIMNKDGQLVYQQQTANEEVLYNTVNTARGETYSLVLADGSRIWLDAASSIRFPTSFTGKERNVEITGQVYFDVKHNNNQPFKVLAKGVEIYDLGTQFNVNAYEDEKTLNVTLVEGVVAVKSQTLKPGQQAQVNMTDGEGTIKVVMADIDQVTAWKDGLFNFKNADVPTVMKEISRWYDLDVKYEGEIPAIPTTGKAPRGMNLATMLQIIDLSDIKHSLKGKELTIKSK